MGPDPGLSVVRALHSQGHCRSPASSFSTSTGWCRRARATLSGARSVAMRPSMRMIMTLAGLLTAAGGVLATAPPAGASVPGVSVVAIRNLGSGKCAAPVPGPDGVITYAGLPIQQFTCDNQNRYQSWVMWAVGYYPIAGQYVPVYHMINQGTGQCLD